MLIKQKPIIGLFIVAFILSLIITMPMKQLYQWGVFPDTVILKGINGRALKGSVRHIIIEGEAVNNVAWSVNALSLLMGKLSFDWTVNDEQIKGRGNSAITLLGTLSVNDVKLTINSERFTLFLPQGNQLAGMIGLDVDTATFNEQLNELNATLELENIIITSPVGAFNLDASQLNVTGTVTDGFEATLTEIDNEENFTVFATVKDTDVTLSGQAHKEARLTKELISIFPLIAKEQGEQWIISWQGVLPFLKY